MLLKLDDIKFQRVDEYIHVYNIPNLHGYLEIFKEEFINGYYNEKVKKKRDTLLLNNSDFTNIEISKIFNFIVQNYYIVDYNKKVNNIIGVYIQDNKQSWSTYHQHLPSSISVTSYINPPIENQGGELQFYLHETYQPKILPQKDCIYVFPSFLLHRPLPSKTKQKRICINWVYDSDKRPIHKLTGDRW